MFFAGFAGLLDLIVKALKITGILRATPCASERSAQRLLFQNFKKDHFFGAEILSIVKASNRNIHGFLGAVMGGARLRAGLKNVMRASP